MYLKRKIAVGFALVGMCLTGAAGASAAPSPNPGQSLPTATVPTADDNGWFSEVPKDSDAADLDAVDVLSSEVDVPLNAAPTRSGTATLNVTVGGITCTTAALNPHPSSHVPGTINAEIRQTCNVAVAKNSAEAKLWVHRWWGYNIIDGPNFTDLATRKVSSAYANASCRTNSIRVTGYGHFEVAGVHYVSQEVMNTKDVSC
jgi:hypothetical protein